MSVDWHNQKAGGRIDMRKMRVWLTRLVAVIFVVTGSMIWMSRLSHEPQDAVEKRLSGRFMEIKKGDITDLTKECRNILTEQGWILFVIDSTLRFDSETRTYFETGPEPLGLYVEYEPGLFRLGLGLGPGPDSSRDVPLRSVRHNEQAVVFVAVTSAEVRVLMNGTDRRADWPGYLADEWACEAAQIPSDNRASSHGYKCASCNTTVRYVSGNGLRELEETLDAASNVRQFNIRRLIGSGLVAIGVLLLLLSSSRKLRGSERRSRQQNARAQAQ